MIKLKDKKTPEKASKTKTTVKKSAAAKKSTAAAKKAPAGKKKPAATGRLTDKSIKSPVKKAAAPPVKKRTSGNIPAPKETREIAEIEEIDPEALSRGDHPMSVVEHLDEFRSRFLKVFLAFIILTFTAFYFSDTIVYYINKPFLETNNQLHIFKLTGGFMLKFKASAGTAILVLIPYILFHAWRFIAPAIGKTERMFSRLTIITGVLLFYSGVAFVFFMLIPFSIKMFLSFITNFMQTTIGADDYLNLIFIFCLIMGMLFELPIIMLVLTKFGIVSPQLLIAKRKYAIVLIWVISAFVSPPDVISMTLCGFPLMALYEISIVLSRFMIKRKKLKDLAQN